jgi:predicted metalloendopeptidase
MVRLLLRSAALIAALALVVGGGPLRAAMAPTNPGVDLADLDPTCKACDDFTRFATGGWMKHHPIPAAYPAWSPWNELQDRNEALLRSIVESAAKDAGASGDSGRIGTYYRTCMDVDAQTQRGAAPLADELAKIDAVTDAASFQSELIRVTPLIATAAAVDFPHAPLMAISNSADPRNSSVQIASLMQSGLSLPDRAYYLAPQYAPQRASLLAYGTRILTLAGETPDAAAADAKAAIALETTLAADSMKREDIFDPQQSAGPKNLLTFAQVRKLAPTIDFPGYFAALHVPTTGTIDVATLDYFRKLSTLLATRPVGDLKAYLKMQYVSANASVLGKPFDDAAFAYTKALTGQKEQRARWKRCLAATSSAMPEALGKLFVAKAFPPAAKARAVAMVDNLRRTLRGDISDLAWMTPATREAALVKLDAIREKIGYPAHFRDYSTLAVGDDAVQNLANARRFAFAFGVAQIGKPTNRDLWAMEPQLLNAQYDPTNNDITFPAAILLPPFFDANADDAPNYGAIGMVIGHEMTHGFDNTGRQYDAKGNLRDWWTPKDAAAFTTRSSCIVHEYDGLTVVGSQKQKGKLVQGEAIADFGGLTIAYRAFEKAQHGKPRVVIDGYTPEQRFFLAFAKVWAENATDKVLSLQGQSNEHPIDRNRIFGTLQNMPEFAAAFHCKAGDRMVAAHPCEIW